MRTYAPAPTPMPIMLLTLWRHQQLQENQDPTIYSHSINDPLLMGGVDVGGGLLKLSQHRGEHFSQLVHGGVAITGDKSHTYTYRYVYQTETLSP